MAKHLSQITESDLIHLEPKMAFFDVDGTLVNSKHQVSDSAKSSLRKLQASGVKLGLASGRAYFAAKKLIADLNIDGPCCMLSGALLIDPSNNQIILENELSNETSLNLVKTCRARNLTT